MSEKLVELRDLHVRFHGQRNVHAVNGIVKGTVEIASMLVESLATQRWFQLSLFRKPLSTPQVVPWSSASLPLPS